MFVLHAFLLLLVIAPSLSHHIPTTLTHIDLAQSTHANQQSFEPEILQALMPQRKKIRFPPQRRSAAHGEVSLSPQPETTSTPSSNSTQTSQDRQNSPTRLPTTEAILTATFRIIMTIMTFFNVNFTWQIHGMQATLIVGLTQT